MLTVETIAKVRNDCFVKEKAIKKIARDRKLSRNNGLRLRTWPLWNGSSAFRMNIRCCCSHSTENGFMSNGGPSVSGCRPSKMASTMSGARSDSRSTQLT
jgi:hypothetical protein